MLARLFSITTRDLKVLHYSESEHAHFTFLFYKAHIDTAV